MPTGLTPARLPGDRRGVLRSWTTNRASHSRTDPAAVRERPPGLGQRIVAIPVGKVAAVMFGMEYATWSVAIASIIPMSGLKV